MTDALGEHFYRHEYGRIVAMLSRRVGLRHLASVEDAVQAALLASVEAWPRAGVPDNPSAWLYRVAYNHVIGELRARVRRDRLATTADLAPRSTTGAPAAVLAGDIRDDLLRMLVACCHESIPVESRLVVALKTLCGFDVGEIAARLFTTEANVYKRLARARQRLSALPFELRDVSTSDLAARLPAVRSVLYLLFTEGHLSSHPAHALRRELCDEATRLATLLAEHPSGATPETFALLALMHLHTARMTARQDAAGGLLLLDEQDRSLWDQDRIAVGLRWLAESAQGHAFSRYHAEAGIAAEHCLAATFGETRWERIVECYTLLEEVAPSALHTLNRALALAEWRGPEAGLAVLDGLEPPSWLEGSYMWMAVLADLHRRCGHEERAGGFREAALAAAPSGAIREALARRLRRAVSDVT